MNISTMQIGLAVLATMIVVGVISYFLGVRKTNAPFKAAALGFIFSIIPVLGIIYVVYLSAKEDLK